MFCDNNEEVNVTYFHRGNKTNSTGKRCSNFLYKREDWTVVIDDNAISTNVKCTKELSNLVKGNGVKLIQYANGSTTNKGCTGYSSKCYQSAYYDYTYNTRINVPPCCRQKIKKVYQDFSDELNRMNISHVLVFGGVLGWMRNKKMIPYDGDLDIIIDGSFWNTTDFWRVLRTLNETYGHTYEMRDHSNKLCISYSLTNSNKIDVWPFYVRNYGDCSYLFIPHNSWVPQPLENIFPTKTVAFEEFWVNIPRSPKAYLDSTYGKDMWLNELDCKFVQNTKCMAPKVKRVNHHSLLIVAIPTIILLSLIIVNSWNVSRLKKWKNLQQL